MLVSEEEEINRKTIIHAVYKVRKIFLFLPQHQDSPAVKFTYTANVTVPKHLVALVSATATGSTDNADSTTTFTFEQKV